MNKPTPMESANTTIWEKLCETDPSRTKDFRKGFSGTSINPNYIYEKLTAVFGPCGIGWGFEVAKEGYIQGHGEEQTHEVLIGFWYMSGTVRSAPIPAYGCTAYVLKDKNGWHTDEDAPKKSMTDALTKASQLIGMSADIFGGQWNDNKYVAALKEKFESKEPANPANPANRESEISEISGISNPASLDVLNPEAKKEEPKSAPESEEKPAAVEKSDTVSKAQAGLVYHKFKDSGFSDEDIKRYLAYHYQVDSNFRLPKTAVKVIVGLFDAGELAPVPEDAGETEEDDIPF